MSTLPSIIASMKSALRTKKAECQVLEKQINELEQVQKERVSAVKPKVNKPTKPARKGVKK